MPKTTSINDSTFLDKDGKLVKVGDVISQDECWFMKREGRWVLTHKAIQKIADVAGISKNFDIEESKTNIPSYTNELEHVIRLKIRCLSKPKDSSYIDSCIHSVENHLTVTGEANRINTPNRGRGYLRKMAEKRAFDIAVLEHVGLYTTTFSEEESEKFEQVEKEAELQPGTKEFEDIAPYISKILNATSQAELKAVSKEIKKIMKITPFTDLQLKYLRGLYNRELNKKTPTTF